ncbi:hypothetical protein V6N11_082688 [Hibiscus sabdariffa]|uniref:Uncharacterized protein n=1 Tax=Hibiscus sabdariffa TaxID=183260 RepID=A0ABR2A8U4_9ROSI
MQGTEPTVAMNVGRAPTSLKQKEQNDPTERYIGAFSRSSRRGRDDGLAQRKGRTGSSTMELLLDLYVLMQTWFTLVEGMVDGGGIDEKGMRDPDRPHGFIQILG